DGAVNQLDLLFLIHNYGGEITSPTDTTPTPEPATPTPGSATPTATPIVDVPTMTPTPTLQPTLPPPPTITPIPTPLPCNLEEFTENFDSVTSIDQSQLITYDEATIDADTRAALVSQGRLPDGKELIPWFLFDETTGSADDGAALSTPNSAAFNSEDTFPFTYYDNQVSILEINQTFNTNCAAAPRIEFDVAFDMEQLSNPAVVRDFLVVEAYSSANDAWEPIDINGDNQVITDLTVVGDGPLTQGSFDGIFDTQLDLENFDFQLEKSDFVRVTGVLPKDEVVRIAFRFESDNSTSDSLGAFIDNIRVYDAAPSGDPVITAVNPVDGDALYSDTQNRVTIQGQNLTPLTEVVFNAPGGAVNLIGGVSGNDVTVTLPALSDPVNAATATLQITRADGTQSNVFEVSINAAPKPVITNIDPISFPLSGADTFLTITGENFRPLFDGATASNSTIVIARQGSRTITMDDAFDYDVRTGTRIEVDAFRLQNLDPGDVEISILNPLSNIESDPFTISLASAIDLREFLIEVGGLGGHSYEPSIETYLLQRDQMFTLFWDGEGFISNSFNVAINGATIIENASASANIPSGSVDLAVGQFNTTLSLSPLLIPDTGTITAEIWNTGGPKQSVTFELNDPQAPLLYPDEVDDDWNDQTLSASVDNEISVVGDNFRGLGIQTITPETPTKFYLIPVGSEDEIALPSITDSFDINIQPLFGTGAYDEMTQLIPAGTIEAATQQYRLKAVNPDSGLSVTSDESQTIQFTP
ncbi:IPT/TIG domain-containing protein, partial [bacterium]|nr:IPT/TIG domain-containing protein [bacterium]